MFSIVALAVAASLPVIDSIHIESRWGGLGQPHATTYTVVRRDAQYERGSDAVPRAAIDRFVAAITTAPVWRMVALRGLATREWLMARATEPHDGVFVPVCSQEAKRLLNQHLADPEEALRTLDHYFSTRWTDDYPLISIDVTVSDGHTIHLESHAQHALMLPWYVGNLETWNLEIPRALVALLPDGAEARLTDRNLARAYVEEVVREMRGPIDDLEERCVHRSFLAAVQKQFEVVRVYHGMPGWFTAYVHRDDFPANLVLTLVIRNDDRPDAQAKLDDTVKRTKAYVDLVRDYVEKHPANHFAIWCADGVSVERNDRAVKISD